MKLTAISHTQYWEQCQAQPAATLLLLQSINIVLQINKQEKCSLEYMPLTNLRKLTDKTT